MPHRIRMSDQSKPQILYVNNIESGESESESRAMLLIPRLLGYTDYYRRIDPEHVVEDPFDFEKGTLAEACDFAWALSRELGTELVIASNDFSFPLATTIAQSVREHARGEFHSDVWTYNTGRRQAAAGMVSGLLQSYRLAHFTQQQMASRR
jgi:hypothetical protein